jgi:hypothetical protein
MRLLRSAMLKLSHRPATLRTFLLLAGFLALIYVALGLSTAASTDAAPSTTVESMLTFPGASGSLASMLLIFCGMAGAAYAGVVAGSEWTWGTFRVALTRGESRVRYVAGLFLGIALLALVAWFLLYAFGVGLILLAARLGGTGAGDPFDAANLGPLAVLVVGGGWAVLMEVAIGFGAAFLTRSQVAGVTTVVGLFFAERFAEMFVPADLLRFAPLSAAEGLVKAAGKTGLDGGLAVPLVVTTLYLLAAIGLAGVAARRSQVA